MKRLLSILVLTLMVKMAGGQCTPSPTMNVTNSPTSTQLLRVTFTSTTPAVSFPLYIEGKVHWGDGSNTYLGSGTAHYHNYNAPGTYTVTYVYSKYDSLTNLLVCKDSAMQNITVTPPPCYTTFTAVNTDSATSEVTFTATTPAGTPGLTYTWNFGDGTTGTGATVSHSYFSNNPRIVTLTVTGSGCSNTSTKIVYPYHGCYGRTAKFNVQMNGYQAIFTNTSSSGSNNTYHWDFGDGNSSTVASPSHIYSTTGTYQVKLTTSFDSLCTDIYTYPVTVSNQWNSIHGYIIKDSTDQPTVPNYKVWLIVFDSTSNILSAVDSLSVSGSGAGQYAFYQFSNKPVGQYRVKAAMLNNVTIVNGYVPTYHTSSLFWNTASVINHFGGSSNSNVYMQKGTVTSGPGFVGGDVNTGANKGTSAGVAGVMMYLMDLSDNMVAGIETDANGSYSFGKIPQGSYRVIPELGGYLGTPSPYFTISSEKAKVEGMNFNVSVNAKTITPIPAGIASMEGAAGFNIYPNPARDKATIQWSSNITADANIIITDVAGKKVLEMNVTTTKNVELDLSKITKGFYFLTIISDNAQQTQKLIIE